MTISQMCNKEKLCIRQTQVAQIRMKSLETQWGSNHPVGYYSQKETKWICQNKYQL